MKVIFLTDVKKQAKKDEIKDVKDGYATYLINNHLAVPYTSTSIKVLNNQVKERHDKEEALVSDYNKIKKQLENKNIKFKVKTGERDKVFGSISTKQISEELTKLGFNIDKKKIEVKGDINTLGTHQVQINLHKRVSFNINVVLEK